MSSYVSGNPASVIASSLVSVALVPAMSENTSPVEDNISDLEVKGPFWEGSPLEPVAWTTPPDSDDPVRDKQAHAAQVIQRAWRRHIDTHVFQYYKHLIGFRNQGDPRLLLKYVNPKETTFPPNIYYKIYTHRPIVDMCASSPKDYTSPSAKQPLMGQLHHHGPAPQDDRSGWYRRTENNGWRLLSGKIALMGDTVTQDSSNRKMEFHFSKVQRRQEVERKRKQRKIEWMKKMYEEGILQARTVQPDTAALVQKAAEGMMAAVDEMGPNHVLEWEVDELLEWTNSLNFEEYMNEWKETATSSSSDSYKGSRLVLSHCDQRFSGFSQEYSLPPTDSDAMSF
ncbi:protein MFI isoform X2 [Amia ocellicauda]|uniref:protein MFI isoform X2 n=1 Tax=Amia ocellicauda TaxID=2972642 RepID=UPI0034644716